MVRLEVVELKEGAKKTADRQAEAMEEMRPEHDALAVSRRRRDFFRRRGARLNIAWVGQPPCVAQEVEVVLLEVGAIPGTGVRLVARHGC